MPSRTGFLAYQAIDPDSFTMLKQLNPCEPLRRIVEDLLQNRGLHDDPFLCGSEAANLRQVISEELGVDITEDELARCQTLAALLQMIPSRLEVSSTGETIIDVFSEVERIARIELHGSVALRWYDRWDSYASLGNWLTRPDSLDFVEMFTHISEDLGRQDEDCIRFGEKVNDTVKFVWAAVRAREDKA